MKDQNYSRGHPLLSSAAIIHFSIFAARAADAVVITKDQDFVRLLERHGPPPKVICVTCGKTSNARLQEVLCSALPKALALFSKGESLVEIRDAL